uniref:Uncharacterized protein n=1 Tax=Anguilla anguilla TaxID=7936 RepID=A0A0E9WH82_ANGAN
MHQLSGITTKGTQSSVQEGHSVCRFNSSPEEPQVFLVSFQSTAITTRIPECTMSCGWQPFE